MQKTSVTLNRGKVFRQIYLMFLTIARSWLTFGGSLYLVKGTLVDAPFICAPVTFFQDVCGVHFNGCRLMGETREFLKF